MAPPREYAVVDLGTTLPEAAAAHLEVQPLRPGMDEVGVQFERGESVVYWLADPQGERVEERAAGASGTRVQTVWRGRARERMWWARDHGGFEVPGLPPGERKNLYH